MSAWKTASTTVSTIKPSPETTEPKPVNKFLKLKLAT